MRKWQKRKSLVSQFSLFTILIIVIQSILMIVSLIVGGVLKQSRENVYTTFNNQVVSRAAYIQSEMDNRWSNIAPYVGDVAKLISDLDLLSAEESNSELLYEVSTVLVAMLRASGATGGFVILDDAQGPDDIHSALYIRDYDPQANSEDNDDLYLVYGPSEVAKHLRISMDRTWSYGLKLNEENGDFVNNPLEASQLSTDYKKLGYWSRPFRLSHLDDPVITYSVPLLDVQGKVHGVIGVEISQEFFKKMLPANELATKDSLGYMLVWLPENAEAYRPLITKGGYQNRYFKPEQELDLSPVSTHHNLYQVTGENEGRTVYGSLQPLTMYRHNTPYSKDTWAIIGLVEEDQLLYFVNLILGILIISFFASLFLGLIGGVFISRRMTKPIASLADSVENHDFTKNIALQRTGLLEIDELADAIESANRNALDSTMKISQIMDLVNVKIGVFEHREGEEGVLLTSRIYELLDLPQPSGESLSMNYTVFSKRISEIRKCQETEEQEVFMARCDPEKWVKIQMITRDNSRLGVISDVTEEIKEKHRLQTERDYDSLTRLYNRAAFQKNVEQILEKADLKSAALVMFDLDCLKQINDTYGHRYGDLYIQETARRLSNFPSEHAVVGRRSGDEFYVFFYGYQGKQWVRDRLDGFYQELAQYHLLFPNGEDIQVRISSGVSWFGEDAGDYGTLMEHADRALYKIKQSIKGSLGEYEVQADPTPINKNSQTAQKRHGYKKF